MGIVASNDPAGAASKPTDAVLESYACNCEDYEAVISPSAYLADLLDYVTTHVEDGSETPGSTLDGLEGTLYQPFGALSASADAATEDVTHVRLTVESLLGFVDAQSEMVHTTGSNPADDLPGFSDTEPYRVAAYDALLDAWGVSRDDLRNAAYDDAEREWVADALGVPTDRVDDFRLDPDAPADAAFDPTTDAPTAISQPNLEALFGLPALVETDDGDVTKLDPLRTIGDPAVREWRHDALAAEWFEADHPDDAFPMHRLGGATDGETIDDDRTRPIVDPDVIGPDDFRAVPPDAQADTSGNTTGGNTTGGNTTGWNAGPSSSNGLDTSGVTLDWRPSDEDFDLASAVPTDDDAFELWEHRRQWLDDELAAIHAKTPAGPGDTIDVRGSLNDMLDAVSYRGTDRDVAWYPSTNAAASIPSDSTRTDPDGPLDGRGFLFDIARLHDQLTGDEATAREARTARANTGYPTGDPNDDAATAARTVVHDALRLTEPAFTRLVTVLRSYYALGETLDDDDWWEFSSILGGVRKRAVFDAWMDEETSSHKVHLDRTTFWRSRRQPSTGEWSGRLDRHDPPKGPVEPFVDPERLTPSDLPEPPRGRLARDLYERRRSELDAKRASFTRTFEDAWGARQADYETMVDTHDSALATLHGKLPDDGSVPDDLASKSPVDDVLDDQYGNVNWPADLDAWDDRLTWVADGLALAAADQQTLSADESTHANEATAKLDELEITHREFDELHRLRDRATLAAAAEGGLTPEGLASLFAVLPTGNALDGVLSTVYDARRTDDALDDVYGSADERWEPVFERISRSFEGSTGESAAGSAATASGTLDALDLSKDEFERVLALRSRAQPGSDATVPEEAVVAETISLLTSVWKRLEKYDTDRPDDWISAERDAGVTDYWDAYKARLPTTRVTRADRTDWQDALLNRSSPPIVDPDVLAGVDDFETPGWTQPGFDLWQARDARIDGDVADSPVGDLAKLTTDVAAGNAPAPEEARETLDAAVRRTVGVSLPRVGELAVTVERGEDVGVELGRLDLTAASLSAIDTVADRLGDRPVRASEWRDVQNVLLGIWKQRQYGRWQREERAHGVSLTPTQFDLPDADDDRAPPTDADPTRWRVDWTNRTAWEDVLESRTETYTGVDDEIEAAVTAAEKCALPILRRQLVELFGTPEALREEHHQPPPDDPDDDVYVANTLDDVEVPYDARAEWVSERLCIDLRMTPDRETTRVSQATTTLQTLVQSLALSLEDASGLGRTNLVLDDEYYDRRWEWLGTYAKWKAAMGVYVYPQNVLLPTLRKRTTDAFDRIARRLTRADDLSAADARAAVDEYGSYVDDVVDLDPVASTMAPGPVVRSRGEDEPDALAYVVGKSESSGRYYLSAFDPESDTHPAVPNDLDAEWPDRSTWRALPPALQGMEECYGAVTYDGEIYLVGKLPEDGDDSKHSEDDEEREQSSSGSEAPVLSFVRYDVQAGTWGDPQPIDLPDEDEIDGTTYDFEGTTLDAVRVVRTGGWDTPPSLVVRRHTWQGGDLESFHYHVDFDDRSPEPRRDYDVTEAWDSDLRAVLDLSAKERVVVYDRGYQVYVGHSMGGAMLAEYGLVGHIPHIEKIDDVVLRPHDGQFVLLDRQVERDPDYSVWYDRVVLERTTDGNPANDTSVVDKTPNDLTSVRAIDGGRVSLDFRLDDLYPHSLVQANSVVERPSMRSWETNEVLTGSARVGDVHAPYLPASVSLQARRNGALLEHDRDLAPSMRDGFAASHLPGIDGEAPADSIETIRDETAANEHVYVEEAYYFLPIVVARQLARTGNFEAALDWFRTVYDYTVDADESARWPPLDASDAGGQISPRGNWLLDPIDPHAIAELRADGPTKWGDDYTKFTLFAIADCLADYADQEFATDTPESVAAATTLYEQALDVLDRDVLAGGRDPCEMLLSQFEDALTEYVFDPEVWTSSTYSESEIRIRAEEIRETVRDVEDYTDRKATVEDIVTELADGGADAFVRAYDAANEIEESDPATDESSVVPDWFSKQAAKLVADPPVERVLANTSLLVDYFGTGSSGSGTGDAAAVDAVPADDADSSPVADADSGPAADADAVPVESETLDPTVVGNDDLFAGVRNTTNVDAVPTDLDVQGRATPPSSNGIAGGDAEPTEGAARPTYGVAQPSEATAQPLDPAVTSNSRSLDWMDTEATRDVTATNVDYAGLVDAVGGGGALNPDVATEGDENPAAGGVDVPDSGVDVTWTSDAASTVDAGTLDVFEATRHQFCIPENPYLASLQRRAAVNLAKIRDGRNIAGMQRELDPYGAAVSVESATPTPDGRVAGTSLATGQPTEYRYETLLNRAKDLADRARQFETEFLSSIEKGEREALKIQKARQQVELARERVSLQETRLDRAEDKVELAKLEREKARIRKQTYDRWLDSPLVAGERAAMSSLQIAQQFQQIAGDFQSAAAGFSTGAAALQIARASVLAGTAKPAKSLGAQGTAMGAFANAMSSFAGAFSTKASVHSTQAQIDQLRARKQRRTRKFQLKQEVAEVNVEIGDQRIELAEDTIDIVEQEREIAELETDHAEDVVNFHENKFTNQALYEWMSSVLEGVYRHFLQQAASVARMAQRQLAFERQSMPREFIKRDYWDAPTSGESTVPAMTTGDDMPDRRGLTGSARLLQDLYELDQYEFETDQRRLECEKTISLSAYDPMALQQFRETGVLSFSTTLEDFDLNHPGHYHRLVKDVDVDVVALTPATAGINAELSNSGNSRIVVGDTLFQERTISRNPERVVLNAATSDRGGRRTRLQPDADEFLRPFENSGVATDWELRMPKAANDMNYDTVVDVQFTIEYTALESYEYRQRVLSEFDSEVTNERVVSLHDDCSDAWYDLVNAPDDVTPTTVSFDLDREDFPANLSDLSIDTLQCYLAGPVEADAREDFKDLEVTVSKDGGSEATSRATDGVVETGSTFAGSDVDGSWTLTVDWTGHGDPFADGTVDDVLLFVGTSGRPPAWPR